MSETRHLRRKLVVIPVGKCPSANPRKRLEMLKSIIAGWTVKTRGGLNYFMIVSSACLRAVIAQSVLATRLQAGRSGF
jgi:hypothetical protein